MKHATGRGTELCTLSEVLEIVLQNGDLDNFIISSKSAP